MARHILDGAVIDPNAPLSVIQVSGGDGTVRHIIGGAVIDADHPLAVHDASGGGGGVTTHHALTDLGLQLDDHPQYQLRSEKAQANGYVGLGAGGLVPTAQLGTGSSVATKFLRGDQTWQTLPAQDFAYSSLTGAPDLTQYVLVDGTRAMSGNLRAPTISIGGAPITGPLLSIPVAPTASANYGLVSWGSGLFDGTAGAFAGNANGTHLAINTASNYPGRMLDIQRGGLRMFAVGIGTQASATGATLNAIDIPAFTVTVTGNTAITTALGFNYLRVGAPVYTAGSAVAITNAGALVLEGPPTGAGSVTISNAYTLWSQAGTNRFDGRLIETVNGAASAPALTLSGAPFAGTGTTSFPLLYINDSAATASTTLSTAGTSFGINGHGTSDRINVMTDGVSKFKVLSTGEIGVAGAPTIGWSLTDYFGGIIQQTNVTAATSYNIIKQQRSRGTAGSPTVVVYVDGTESDDGLGGYRFLGYDGAAYRDAAKIISYVDGTPGAGSMPGRLSFWTTPSGSVTPLERLRITSGGNINVVSGALGFGSATAPDLFLHRDAANIIAQRNATTAQVNRLYGTFTDASNYERLAFITAAGDYSIVPQAAGTGTLRGMQLGTSAGKLGFYGTTAITQQVLATGAAKLVDDVITALQNLGLVKQS